MKSFRSVCVLALLVAILLSIGPVGQAQEKKAPNFRLKSHDGKVVELAKLKGKLVVVNFWATWCGPCRAEIPGFVEVYEKYRGKGLEIVGISLDDGGWNQVKPYIEKMKMSYLNVIGDGDLAQAYGGIQAIPTTFIVDKEGNVVKRHIGYMNKKDFEELVQKYL
jgi:thiol-disulfide isomerase/thioredoxin